MEWLKYLTVLFIVFFIHSAQVQAAPDYLEVTKELVEAASTGDADAQNTLGQRYYNRNTIGQSYYDKPENAAQKAKNYARAFKWTLEAAEQGHASASARIIDLYEKGLGTEKDSEKAAYWHQRLIEAASAGDADAQGTLGRFHWNRGARAPKGPQKEKHQTKSFFWNLKAAKQGKASASKRLAEQYEHGWGTEQNSEEAAYWYRRWVVALEKQASEGSLWALHQIAVFYEKGMYGKQKDIKEAIRLYERAAERDYTRSLTQLGNLYFEGIETTRNYDKAHDYWHRAGELGNAIAKKNAAVAIEHSTLDARWEQGSKSPYFTSVSRNAAAPVLVLFYELTCYQCIKEFKRHLPALQDAVEEGALTLIIIDVNFYSLSSDFSAFLHCLAKTEGSREYMKSLNEYMSKISTSGSKINGTGYGRRSISRGYDFEIYMNVTTTLMEKYSGVNHEGDACRSGYNDSKIKVKDLLKNLDIVRVPMYVAADNERFESWEDALVHLKPYMEKVNLKLN